MPTYGYRCKACAGEFDVWQKMSDEPVATCPTCGGAGKRLFFPAGIVFKGSGFYATDSRRSSSTSSAPAGNGSGKSGTSSTSGPSSTSGTSSDTGSSTPSGGSSASTSSE